MTRNRFASECTHVEGATQNAAATGVSLALPLSPFTARPSERKASFSWSTSWIPTIILLLSDLFSWPALFLLFSQLRSSLVGSAGQIEWQILVVPAVVSAVVLNFVGGYDRRIKMVALA